MTLPDHVFATLERVCAAYPHAVVKEDFHLGEILNAVAYAHRDEGWGLSRKTGGRHVDSPAGAIAEDILQLPDGNHFDVLGSAAVGNPLRPGRATSIGIINLRDRPWVAPVAHTPAWMLPPAPPDPEPPVPQPPAPSTDLSTIKASLAAIQEQQQVIIAAVAALASKGEVHASVSAAKDALYDLIDKTLINQHVLDVLNRLDRNQETATAVLEKLNGSRLLRF